MPEEKKERPGPPENFAFEYNHVSHVAPKSKYANEDEFKAEVIAKYKAPAAASPPASNDKALLDRIRELEAKLEAQSTPEVPSVPKPETQSSTGKGVCPICQKSFKRLDMHVCHEAEPDPPPEPEQSGEV